MSLERSLPWYLLLSGFTMLVHAADAPHIIVLPCGIGQPPAVNMPGAGGAGVITVGQTASCGPISVGSDVAWANAQFLVKSTQNTVLFTVQPNRSATPRSARIAFTGGNSTYGFASSVFTIDQAGSCATTLSQTQATLPYTGGSGTLHAALLSPGCRWSANSDARWVQPYPISGTASSAVSYTVYPNFSTQQRNAVVTVGDRDITITQAGNPRTANERAVQFFYFASFGRLPSEAEIAFQVFALQTGLTRAQLFGTFFNGPEFQLGGRLIAGAYFGLLRRLPEYSGWLFQRNAIAVGGASELVLIVNFLASAEYGLQFGSPTPSEFVRLLYRHILFREATQAEVDFQTLHLGPATLPQRAALARTFLLSDEFRQSTNATLNAFLLTAALLGRDPGGAEMSDLQIIQQTRTLGEAIDYLFAFPEFAATLQ